MFRATCLAMFWRRLWHLVLFVYETFPRLTKCYNFVFAKITEMFLLRADDGNNRVYDS